MKSLEVKFAEALAELRKASASKYNTVFDECQKLTTLEAKVSCVEAALLTVKESFGNKALEELDEAMRDYAILFGGEPRQTTITEARPPIKKHNGAGDNFVEGSPFNGDRSKAITETDATKTKEHVGKSGKSGDQIIRESLGITEVKAPEGLTRTQQAEYDLALRFGFNESDALKLAKLPLIGRR